MPKVKSDDLIKELYAALRTMILSGELSPGEKLIQEELASKLGVSRTPLLRALQMLESELLVASVPRRGMYVRKMSTEELRDAFQLRAAIETMSCAAAAAKIRPEEVQELRDIFAPFASDISHADPKKYQEADKLFHKRILDIAGNSLVSKLPIIDNILQFTYQRGLIRLPAKTLGDHLRIIEALASHDAPAAEQAMREHLGRSVGVIEERLEGEPR